MSENPGVAAFNARRGTAPPLMTCYCGQVAPAEPGAFPHPGCDEGTAERRARYFAEEEAREFLAWLAARDSREDEVTASKMAEAFTAGQEAGARLSQLAETVDRSARYALFHDEGLPEGVTLEGLLGDPPAVYARWCRAGWPTMTAASIAALWRWRSAGEYKFWLGLEVAR